MHKILTAAKNLFAWARREPVEAAYYTAAAILVLVGIALRVNGYLFHPIGLWGDEAHWALHMSERPSLDLLKRPVGFIWVTKHLANALGYDERTLRFIPWVASILTMLIVPAVGRMAFRSRLAAILLIALVAFHPALIDYAKEFKAYAAEAFIHLAIIALFLAYQRSRHKAFLYLLAIAAPLSFLFAYNIVFLYPALFTLLAVATIQQRLWWRLIPICVSAALCLGGPAGFYSSALSSVDTGRQTTFWGNKYGAFYVAETKKGSNKQSRVDWMVKRWGDIAAMPGVEREKWNASWVTEGWPDSASAKRWVSSMRDAAYYACVVAHILGLVGLANRRRFDLLALLASPLVVALAFNQAGWWPFTDFRVNIFMLAYSIPLVCYGFDGVLSDRRLWVVWPSRVAIVAAFCLPSVLFGFNTHSEKQFWTTSTNFVPAMETIRAAREATLASNPTAPPEKILADSYACGPVRYYTRLDAKSRRRHGEFFDKNFVVKCTGRKMMDRVREQKNPFWVVLGFGAARNKKMARGISRAADVTLTEEHCSTQLLLRAHPKKRERKKRRGDRD